MSQEKKLKPFGEIPESFGELKNEGLYYVDKTGFIPYLITKKRKICVVTRPRRFGKTLMLRTLQTFFEYRLDDDGKPVDNRRYFEGLKVMDSGDEVLKEMGQYPVISLSFKNVFGNTYEKVVSMLNDAVCKACKIHGEQLMASGKLSLAHKQWLQTFMDGNATEDNLQKFLGLYMQWLKDVTGRETVVLIDEYDVPLQKAAIHDIKYPKDKLFDKTVELIGQFISSGFKSNNNLAYGIIAGCMRVAKESIFTGMNNPGVITVLDDIPEEFWGFTEDEVKQMLSYYDIADWYPRIEEWYDGYEYSGRKVFNPWSLLHAIRGLVNGSGENAFQAYWGLTSGNDIIDEMIAQNPQHREALARLMDGETMTVPVVENLSYRDLIDNPHAIWSFLLYTGYLKSLKIWRGDDCMRVAEVAIPNSEVYTIIKSSLQRWWKNSLTRYNARPLMQALWSGDVPEIKREIDLLMNESISVKDAKEDFYHGMLVGVLRTQCEVKSNRESGTGYPDIVVVEGKRAAILELKCLLPSQVQGIPRREEFRKIPPMMQKLLDEAETQIRTQYYIEGLRFEKSYLTEIKTYAVCFFRKMCMVREVRVE